MGTKQSGSASALTKQKLTRPHTRTHAQTDMAEKEEKASASGAAQEHLNIKVKQDDSEIVFKIKKTTPLKKLMNAFCSRQNLDRGQWVFLYDGERISPENTPEQLGMEDNDEIDAMIHQIGGN